MDAITESVLSYAFVVEMEDGICELAVYPESEVKQEGGIGVLAVQLSQEYPWVEFLGTMREFPERDGGYGAPTAEYLRMTLFCTKKLVRLKDSMELEFRAVERILGLPN